MHAYPNESEILAETDQWLVLSKPANVSLLRDRSGAPDLWTSLNENRKLYLVHRLDKGTSGVLLIAKNQAMQSTLTKAFQQRQVRKFYLAKVVGAFPQGQTHTISLPLKKGRKSRYRIAGPRERIVKRGLNWCLDVSEEVEGFAAQTRVRCLAQDKHHSLLLAQPITGRTHQLRVHLSWIGYPIVGDALYGRPKDSLQQAARLQLHCRRLVVPTAGTFADRQSLAPLA